MTIKMKNIKNIIIVLSALLMMWSCSDDDQKLGKATLVSTEILSFEGTSATPQIITVYADGGWVADAPEWVSITPSSGTGTMDVTVTVTDNIRDGLLDNPRKAKISFHGATLASYAYMTVEQSGDKYRDVPVSTVAELIAANDESFLVMEKTIVSAVGANGAMVQSVESGAAVWVDKLADVAVGDVLQLSGEKLSDENTMPYLEADIVVKESSAAVTYPAATDVEQLDASALTPWQYISATGVIDGKNITTEEKGMVLQAKHVDLDPALNGHIVKIECYYAGPTSNAINVVPAKVEDLGVKQVIFWTEDFEWLAPWAAVGNGTPAGRTVEEDNLDAVAPQIKTPEIDGVSALQALEDRGYQFLRVTTKSPGECIYIQSNYLKFGKTSYQAGIVLPSIDNIPEGTTAKITFDWCPMRQGSGKLDPVNLIVIVENNGAEQVFDVPTHGWENGHRLEWIPAEITLSGAKIDANTKITIRQTQWPEATANRWFLDNIKILEAE